MGTRGPHGALGLEPYVPWLGRDQVDTAAEQRAALLFADVSGYTRLTERLASMGREGSEVLTRIVNGCFAALIDAVRELGGEVVRFGGDALLVVITGAQRVERAAVLAARLQQIVRALPAVLAPGGSVRLRMSIGLHDGVLVTYRWAGDWTEIVPLGPAVTEVLRLESAAAAGEVRVSAAVARTLDGGLVRDGVLRLAAAHRLVVPTITQASPPTVAAQHFIPPALRDVLAHGLAPEHRAVSVAFVLVGATDPLVSSPQRLRTQLDPAFDAVAAVAERFGIVPIGTDVAPNGVKFLLASGVPTATEDDEDRLLTGVKAVIHAMPAATAGIHSGLVFCGDVGHPTRRTFTLMGDVVNLSARLMGKASRGEVVASTTVIDAVGSSFETRWLAPFTVKGKAQLQRAANIGDRLPIEERAPESRTLRGRAVELDRVTARLGEPGAVEIVGAAGIGASRLLHEALQTLGLPAATVRATVEDTGSLLAVAQRALVALGGDIGSIGADLAPAAAVDGFVVALADRWASGDLAEGFVLVVDRIHRADEASTAVFRGLAATINEVGGRLVAVGRASVLDAADPIELGPLDAGAVRRLCIDAATRALSDAELDAFVVRAAGNPRVAALLAMRPPSDADLPASIESVVAAGIDRLPRSVRQVVREAALIGSIVPVDLLATVTGRDAASVADALSRARGAGTLDEERVFRFEDEMLREVAAASLPLDQSRPIHRRVGELLADDPTVAPAFIAGHFIAADDAEGTWRWCGLAAHQAFESGSTTTAATQGMLALAAGRRLCRPDRELLDIAMLAANAANRAGTLEIADAALVAAAKFAGSAAVRADILVVRARIALREFRLRAARAHLAAAARIAKGSVAVAVDIELATLYLVRDQLERASQVAEGAARAARRHHRLDLEARALSVLEEIGEVLGRADNDALAQRALDVARRSGDREVAALAANNIGVSADDRGDWSRALLLYGEAEEHFLAIGDVGHRAAVGINRATVLNDLGDADAVASTVPELRRIAAAAGFRRGVIVCDLVLARAAGRRSPSVESVERATRALARLESVDEPLIIRNMPILIELLLLTGRPGEALTTVDRLLETARPEPLHMFFITLRRLRAMALAATGDATAARVELIDACRLADEIGVLPERCFVRWAWAQLPGGLPSAELAILDGIERELAPVSCVLFRSAWTEFGKPVRSLG